MISLTLGIYIGMELLHMHNIVTLLLNFEKLLNSVHTDSNILHDHKQLWSFHFQIVKSNGIFKGDKNAMLLFYLPSGSVWYLFSKFSLIKYYPLSVLIELYCFTVLEATRPKSKCWQGHTLSEMLSVILNCLFLLHRNLKFYKITWLKFNVFS